MIRREEKFENHSHFMSRVIFAKKNIFRPTLLCTVVRRTMRRVLFSYIRHTCESVKGSEENSWCRYELFIHMRPGHGPTLKVEYRKICTHFFCLPQQTFFCNLNESFRSWPALSWKLIFGGYICQYRVSLKLVFWR